MKKYYEDKGYDLGKKGDVTEIKVEDLSPYSNAVVTVKCDFCGKLYEMKYCKYLSSVKNGNCCYDCRSKKIKRTNMAKYGVENTSQLKELKEKRKKTCLKKYGQVTNLLDKDTKDKIRRTNIEKYGTEYPMRNDKIKEKLCTSICANGHANSSKQQREICDMLNGELNYPIGIYIADIYIGDNICIEYNGSGHRLPVKFGTLSNDEFDKREYNRYMYITNRGYKIIVVESLKDRVPNLCKLEDIVRKAKDSFENGNTLYFINID